MVLARSLSHRYLLYFFVINTTFTLLFNLIECFEKLTRSNGATTTATLTFIKLNFIPSFFDNFPLAAWLALLLLIRELDLYGEWEGLKLLSIKPLSIFYIIGCISLCLSSISYVGKEYLFLHLFEQAESIKTKSIKHNNGTIIDETWFTLNNQTFCHIHQFDKATNQGNGLTLITTNQQGVVKKLLLINSFTFIEQEQKVLFTRGRFLENGTQKIIKRAKIFTPCLSKNNDQPTITSFSKLLETEQDNELWNKKINRFLAHLNTFFFPAITLLIFFMTQHYLHPLIISSTIYPAFLGFSAMAQWLLQQNVSRLIIFMPYLIFLFLIIFLFFKNLRFNQRYTTDKNKS